MCEFAYIKFYPGDFLADTLDLNRADLGSYMLLLMAMWRQDGKLPSEPQGLAKIARMTMRHWGETWGRLKRFFVVSEDGAVITQKRLVAELEDARKRRKPPKPEAVFKVGEPPSTLAAKPLTDIKVAPQRARATPQPERKKESTEVEIRGGATSIGAALEKLALDLGSRTNPTTNPALYSPGEIAALETRFAGKIDDIPKRLPGLITWATKIAGMERENEIKRAIYRALEKRAGGKELEAERMAA